MNIRLDSIDFNSEGFEICGLHKQYKYIYSFDSVPNPTKFIMYSNELLQYDFNEVIDFDKFIELFKTNLY